MASTSSVDVLVASTAPGLQSLPEPREDLPLRREVFSNTASITRSAIASAANVSGCRSTRAMRMPPRRRRSGGPCARGRIDRRTRCAAGPHRARSLLGIDERHRVAAGREADRDPRTHGAGAEYAPLVTVRAISILTPQLAPRRTGAAASATPSTSRHFQESSRASRERGVDRQTSPSRRVPRRCAARGSARAAAAAMRRYSANCRAASGGTGSPDDARAAAPAPRRVRGPARSPARIVSVHAPGRRCRARSRRSMPIGVAGGHELDSRLPAGEPRQPHGAARAGQQAQRHSGKPELQVPRRAAVVAGERGLRTAAERARRAAPRPPACRRTPTRDEHVGQQAAPSGGPSNSRMSAPATKLRPAPQ